MNSVKKNFIYNSVYQILIMFIPLITTPYISRVLGAEGIGTYSYAYSIANYYVLFIMLGLNNYGNRSIARIRDDQQELRKTFWSIYILQFTLGILINLIYIIYCFFLSKDIIISIALGIYVLSASFDINWFFFGIEKFKLTVFRNTFIKVITTIAIFIFVNNKGDVIKYCFIMTLGMLISQVILWPFVLKNIEIYKPTINEVIVHIKPNLFLFLTVIAVSLFKILDKIMLGIMTNKSQVGYYESAEKIISIPIALITSLGTVMLPRMSNIVNKSKSMCESMLNKSIIFAMLLSSSLCFGIMGVSKEFVPIFYGDGYEICIQLFLILLPSCLFLAFANVIRTQYLLPYQMDKVYVVSAFLGATSNIGINLILIPQYGSVGAAFGTLVAEAVVCIYQCMKVNKSLSLKKYIKKTIPFIIAGIVMFTVLWNIRFDVSPLVALILKIFLGIAIYFFIIIIQFILYTMSYRLHKEIVKK